MGLGPQHLRKTTLATADLVRDRARLNRYMVKAAGQRTPGWQQTLTCGIASILDSHSEIAPLPTSAEISGWLKKVKSTIPVSVFPYVLDMALTLFFTRCGTVWAQSSEPISIG